MNAKLKFDFCFFGKLRRGERERDRGVGMEWNGECGESDDAVTGEDE